MRSNHQGERARTPRAALCLLLAIAQLIACVPALAGEQDDLAAKEALLARADANNNRVIEVPRKGPVQYYAQNNPFWSEMEYEETGSPSYRVFGDGGCCPTSAAIAIGAHLTDDELTAVLACSKGQGYGITVKNMNPDRSRKDDGVYWFTEGAELRSYLPLVFGSFACGNNKLGRSWRAKPKQWQVSAGGTSHEFVPELCKIYGLDCFQVTGRYNMDWLSYVRQGATAVALSNTQWQPFVKGKGHYVAIVAADDQYLYIMDPQDKASYERDEKLYHILEVVEPGLLRVKLEDYPLCMFGLLWIIRPQTAEKAADPMSATEWADGRFAQ